MQRQICILFLLLTTTVVSAQIGSSFRLQSFDHERLIKLAVQQNHIIMLTERKSGRYEKGELSVLKTDLTGKVIWQTALEDSAGVEDTTGYNQAIDLLVDNDQIYCLVDIGDKNLLKILSSSGAVLKTCSLDKTSFEPTGLFKTNSGVGISGAKASEHYSLVREENSTDVFLKITDSLGTMVDSMTVALRGSQKANEVIRYPDGRWLIAGSTTYKARKPSPALQMVDGTGHVKWMFSIESPLYEYNNFIQPKIKVGANGEIIMACSLGNYNNDSIAGVIVSLDSTGKKKWQQKITYSTNTAIYDIHLIGDNRILVTGQATIGSLDEATIDEGQGFVAILGKEGNVVSTNINSSAGQYSSIDETQNGTILVGGSIFDHPGGYNWVESPDVFVTTLTPADLIAQGIGLQKEMAYQLLDKLQLPTQSSLTGERLHKDFDPQNKVDLIELENGYVLSGQNDEHTREVTGISKSGSVNWRYSSEGKVDHKIHVLGGKIAIEEKDSAFNSTITSVNERGDVIQRTALGKDVLFSASSSSGSYLALIKEGELGVYDAKLVKRYGAGIHNAVTACGIDPLGNVYIATHDDRSKESNLLKYTRKGKKNWAKSILYEGTELITLIKVLGKDVFISGSTKKDQSYLIKVSQKNGREWKQQFTGTVENKILDVAGNDRKYLVSGFYQEEYGPVGFLAVLDEYGHFEKYMNLQGSSQNTSPGPVHKVIASDSKLLLLADGYERQVLLSLAIEPEVKINSSDYLKLFSTLDDKKLDDELPEGVQIELLDSVTNDLTITHITPDGRGGFYLVGGIEEGGEQLGVVAHFDYSLRKSKEISVKGSSNVSLSGLIKDPEGNFIISGKNGYKGLILYLNNDLSFKWSRHLGGAQDNFISAVAAGNTAIHVSLNNGHHAAYYTISKSSEIQWSTDLGVIVSNIVVDKDSAFALAFSKERSKDYTTCYGALILGLDRKDNIKTSRALGSSSCRSVYETAYIKDDSTDGFVTAGSLDFEVNPAYEALLGQKSFSHAVITRYDRSGSIVWQKSLGLKEPAVFNKLAVLPNNTIIASCVIAIDSVSYKAYLVHLTPSGDFLGGLLISELSSVINITAINNDLLLLHALDQNDKQVIVKTYVNEFNYFDPFGYGAEARVFFYLDEATKLEQQLAYQNTIHKDAPSNSEMLIAPDNYKQLAYEHYAERLAQYNKERKEKLAIDEWTDPADLTRYALKWLSLAKTEVDSKQEFTLPSLKANVYRFFGVKTLASNPVQGIEAIKYAIAIADTLFEDNSIYLVDYLEAQKLIDLMSGDWSKVEKSQRKIISIFESNDPLNEDLQTYYVNSLSYLAMIYGATNRPSDAEEILYKALKYASGLEYGDAVSSIPRLFLAGLLLRKYGTLNNAAHLLEPFDEFKTSGSMVLQMALANLNMLSNFNNQAYDKAINNYFELTNIAKQYFGENYNNVIVASDLLYIRSLRISGDLNKARRVADEFIDRYEQKVDRSVASLFYYELAKVYHQQQETDSALHYIRMATDGIEEFNSRSTFSDQESEQLRGLATKFYYTDYLDILFAAMQANPNGGQLLEESVMIAQKANRNATSNTVTVMTERFRQKNDALGRLLKDQEQLRRKITFAQNRLRNAINKNYSPNVDVKTLFSDVEILEEQLDSIGVEIKNEYPEFSTLLNQGVVNTMDVKSALTGSEAVLMYHIDDSTSFGWLVTKDQTELFKIDLKLKDIEKLVLNIRKTIEPGLLGVKGVGGITNAKPDQPNTALGIFLNFDTKSSYALYRALIKPIENKISNKSNLLIIPSGPLHSIPFGLFLSSPGRKITRLSDYKSLPWFALKFGLSVWPSLASIKELRSSSIRTAQSQLPFVGFGDPVFSGKAAALKGYNFKMLFRNTDETVNLDNLRKLPRLPETAAELRKIARSLNADEKFVFLGSEANEQRIKSTDLVKFKVIAFSTHGFAAGDVEGIVEPALALSPPQKATSLNDGLLTASEIAQLDTQADWVILSACNTASSDGTKGSESLSGLARAFFYSGSRSLLVSHWPVVSASTETLIANTLKKIQQNVTLTKDDALRMAIKELINNKQQPLYAHPMFWAPFMVVGERMHNFK